MMKQNQHKEEFRLKKSDRHALIETLIQENVVKTQEELLALLKEKGVNATQATISRDIRELKLVKTADLTGQVRFLQFQEEIEETNTQTTHLEQLTQDVVTKVDRVQFMTILHTVANNAPILAAAIDEITMKEKICTLAGFDIVTVISPDEASAIILEDFFKKNLD